MQLKRIAVWLVPALVAFSTIVPTANAAVFVFSASLDGPGEAPPNASPGTGESQADFDTTAHTLRVQATFADLLGATVAAHIHGPTAVAGTGVAGVATQTPTFALFPLGVTSGSFDQTLDTLAVSSYNPAFVLANGGTAAGAEAALLAGLLDGKAYFNLHSTDFPGGEIRGFYSLVPVPAALPLLATALTGIGVIGWRRRAA